MKILNTGSLVNHNFKLIVVPEEKLNGSPVSDFTEIETEAGEKLKIVQRVTIRKREPMPSLLMLLSVGQDILSFEVWNKYKKSEFLYFFVCELLNP